MDKGQLPSTGVGGSVSRNHGIAVSRRESGQSDCQVMEERRLYAPEEILIESNDDRLHGWFQFLLGQFALP